MAVPDGKILIERLQHITENVLHLWRVFLQMEGVTKR